MSFVSFLKKVMSERTISLGVVYDEFAFDIVVMMSKSAHSSRCSVSVVRGLVIIWLMLAFVDVKGWSETRLLIAVVAVEFLSVGQGLSFLLYTEL